MVAGHHEWYAPGATDDDFTFALLGGVEGPGLGDGGGGARDGAEVLLDGGQGAVHVELAGDDQDGVVGPVVALVEGLQVVGVDGIHVGQGADDGAGVRVEAVGGGHQLLVEDGGGAVLAGFHFVDDDGALALELAGVDLDVVHGVGQPAEHPVTGFVAGVELAEVVGAVVPGGAVPFDAEAGEFLFGIGNGFGALEQHVFEQVGHAGLAGAFVAGAHLVDQVDGHGGFGFVWPQQDGEAVGELVLADAIDGLTDLDDAGDGGGSGGFPGTGGGAGGGCLGLCGRGAGVSGLGAVRGPDALGAVCGFGVVCGLGAVCSGCGAVGCGAVGCGVFTGVGPGCGKDHAGAQGQGEECQTYVAQQVTLPGAGYTGGGLGWAQAHAGGSR